MKKPMTMALVALGASFVFVASASAAPMSYKFDGLACYQFGGPPTATFNFGPVANPDTSYVVITNNGASTFTGNIGFNATDGFGIVWDSSYAVTLTPGQSASVSINDEASNQCGYNGACDVGTPQQGAQFYMNGTASLGIDTRVVAVSIFDKDIHSGVFQTNPFGVNLDNYIMQGGDPFGRDTGDDYEVAQACGPFQFVTCPSNFDFDFSDSQYTDCFRDLLRGSQINDGVAFGPPGNTALNFTGSTGSTPSTWLTVYDTVPTTPAQDATFGAETLCADVLIQPFNNAKGPGVVALLNEGGSNRGLALSIRDGGNTDNLILSIINPTTGQLTTLTSVSLAGGISQNVWYRLVMFVDPAIPTVTGKVFRHTPPTSPNSPLGTQVGSTLTYSPLVLPPGVATTGENGIMATAINAVVNSSVTNFTNDPTKCP